MARKARQLGEPIQATVPRRNKAERAAAKLGNFVKATHPDDKLISTANPQITLRMKQARQLAAIDYISDPDKRSIADHYDSSQRPWKQIVKAKEFIEWCRSDGWDSRREVFWREVEDRVLAERADQIAQQRITEIEHLTEARGYLEEYMFPLRDRAGNIRRHPKGKDHQYEGLPMYALPMPSIDRFVKTLIALDQQIMVKRGEVTSRNQEISESEGGIKRLTALDPVSAEMDLTTDDVRALAAIIVQRRQPELAQQPIVGDMVEGVVGEDDYGIES